MLAGPGSAAADTQHQYQEPEPDCSVEQCVALTFDDGPDEYTDELLDTLNAHGAAATFYLLGSKVEDHAATVERMAQEGHEVGNHTWDHPELPTLSTEEIAEQIERTDEAIAEVTGEVPETMRPPYGELDETVRQTVDHPMLLWDVDTLDWQSLDPEAVTDVAVEETAQGSVVLFHDVHESTVEAIPYVLKELDKQGFTFVTVDQLFDGQELESGATYNHARPDGGPEYGDGTELENTPQPGDGSELQDTPQPGDVDGSTPEPDSGDDGQSEPGNDPWFQ
ncbi:polysaccharide deacetylase family protein [Nocardiopsis sp. HNM0947]|uniref:Polysaccharide deacetylase family protein n=1 Tax=Nocardiopsis coralli TaxID=2772213 RepID=A0ABR9PCM0_9ACTN|nr:polysaccharide deacetylase family protein [Nocardiopsis coralli]MBE3001591.1 polysaccharide deacetylase family protein [Nocardiopsis coralli]